MTKQDKLKAAKHLDATEYLMSSPANRARILSDLEQLNTRGGVEHELIELPPKDGK